MEHYLLYMDDSSNLIDLSKGRIAEYFIALFLSSAPESYLGVWNNIGQGIIYKKWNCGYVYLFPSAPAPPRLPPSMTVI